MEVFKLKTAVIFVAHPFVKNDKVLFDYFVNNTKNFADYIGSDFFIDDIDPKRKDFLVWKDVESILNIFDNEKYKDYDRIYLKNHETVILNNELTGLKKYVTDEEYNQYDAIMAQTLSHYNNNITEFYLENNTLKLRSKKNKNTKITNFILGNTGVLINPKSSKLKSLYQYIYSFILDDFNMLIFQQSAVNVVSWIMSLLMEQYSDKLNFIKIINLQHLMYVYYDKIDPEILKTSPIETQNINKDIKNSAFLASPCVNGSNESVKILKEYYEVKQ